MSDTSVEHISASSVDEASSEEGRMREVSLFAENVPRLRLEKHLSQAQVSRLSGVHVTEVSRIERGLRDSRLSTLIRLARALDVEPGRLLEQT